MQAPVEQTQALPAMDAAAWKPMSAASFNPGSVTEFIPKGKMVATQE